MGAIRPRLHPATSSFTPQHALAAASFRVSTGATARAAQAHRWASRAHVAKHRDAGAIAPLFWFGALIELVGGALILVGLVTRPVALIASGDMAVAYWMFHAPANPWPVLNGGDAAILYCFVFLLLVFTGPGAWSLDGAVRQRRAPAAGT